MWICKDKKRKTKHKRASVFPLISVFFPVSFFILILFVLSLSQLILRINEVSSMICIAWGDHWIFWAILTKQNKFVPSEQIWFEEWALFLKNHQSCYIYKTTHYKFVSTFGRHAPLHIWYNSNVSQKGSSTVAYASRCKYFQLDWLRLKARGKSKVKIGKKRNKKKKKNKIFK